MISAIPWILGLLATVVVLVVVAGLRVPTPLAIDTPDEPDPNFPSYDPTGIPTFVGLPRRDGHWTELGDTLSSGDVPGEGWWIYRHFDMDNNLMYVGKTNNARRRFGEHLDNGKPQDEGWSRWELYACPSETYMDQLEKLAILCNDPIANKERWRLERHVTDGAIEVEYDIDEYDEAAA